MKVAILAGGRGARLREQTHDKPKPMIEIGGRPILWHIMMHYAHYGLRDFVIATGYRGEVIDAYFREAPGAWQVEVVNTGAHTQTGGRIKRLEPHLGTENFMLTWGDAVSDVDLEALVAFHRQHGRQATLTAVHPPPRFGGLTLDGARVIRFAEKQPNPDEWINGAYFVLEPEVFRYLDNDHTDWDRDTLPGLVRQDQLMAFRHDGYWQCMDTLFERDLLEDLWQRGSPPWKIWN